MTPIDDLGLVDAESVIVGGVKARPRPGRTIDVDRPATAATYQVVMVVVDPILVPGWRPRRLDAPNQPLLGQGAERVVHRLTRDRADLGPHEFFDVVRRAVRPAGHRPQNGQTLSRHLDTMAAK